ncbi:serine hydrolase [Hymenobacter cheonanensis]|uniref:serine hydrolase n=1 Tax=Hymenobacter sp. CA2-7 TaxID=3063993 RepID=UPI0027139ABA|nr:serine hydrolase [Hymenobacter sp. CA2-7]MDO7887487.1 serine hydrolase [Hymenobacter sp. CA2-7]
MKPGLLHLFAVGLLLVAPWLAPAQPRLPRRLLAPADTVGLGRVLARPEFYHLQISLVRVRRDAQGLAHLARPVRYRVRPREYFYPASAVKLAAGVLALEKLERLQASTPGLSPDSPLRTDSAFAGQTRAVHDATAASGRPSLGHYLRKMLLVSDNDAYNRLYEFVGPQELSAGLRRLGLRHARLVHRLSVGDGVPGWRHTNPIRFFADTAETQLLLAQPAAAWRAPLPPARVRPASLHVGQAYVNAQGQQLAQPLDLSQKNVFSLSDLQQLLQAVVLPETVPARQRPHLTAASLARVREALSQLPPQSRSPYYDSLAYPSTYAKYLLGGGGEARLPPGVRVYNKIGQAYGFLIDNAYVVDAAHGVEFLLAAVLYVNADGVLNDDKYDYDTVGLPFLRELGRHVYEAEVRHQATRRTMN